ncbi:response regulator [Paracoccus aerius]|uniref:Response regulator n=1 Tax=Paracoccus aerius TaxID=1915382 RepID=A0ABS1SDA5_9RHOB|nr:response regulator [Paracoccus aerius]MBL3675476.1 response regulator [Paracoccus aerius]GHG34173.1 response regulator [Paracoccus aerius]
MPYRIMIVEDEAILALDLSWLLVDAGYEVAGIARTMHAALRLAAKGSVDLATMDIRLAGGTNGVETALKLWQDHEVRCLFVSASLDKETKCHAQPIGFVEKPIREQDIIASLEAHFRRAT